MNVGDDVSLVGMAGCRVDETWMVIGKKHRPIGQRHLTGSLAEPALFVDVTLMATLSVSMCASIHRINEPLMDGGKRWTNPAYLAVDAVARGKVKSFGTEPEPDLAGPPSSVNFEDTVRTALTAASSG